jgi:uncharacterized repeat protein (TIGR03803 family)
MPTSRPAYLRDTPRSFLLSRISNTGNTNFRATLLCIHDPKGGNVRKFRSSQTLCMLFLFCVLTAIVSSAQTLTTIYSFCSQANCTDGALPHAGVVQGTDGAFYGAASEGTTYGTLFKVTPQGMLSVLHTFDNADGADPLSALVQGTDGNFYGTTFNGGANDDPSCVFGGFVGCGTVFKITPGGSLRTLYNFCSQAYCFDGSNPATVLLQGTDGNFYGTAGGQFGGTVFKITSDGTLATLYFFCSRQNCADGEYPWSLVQGTDGNFYGTTYAGGTSNNCKSYSSNGCGTVFKITPQGMLTTLHSFDSTDGCYPVAGLVQGTDGNLYGTTGGGGTNGYCGPPYDTGGTVFKITPGGILTTLYSFCSQANCADGMGPSGELVQATDGNFYGTTSGGGGHGDCGGLGLGCGTVFRITPGGALTTLHSFCSLANCADGILPNGALVQATDGAFYGTTYEGGANGAGTVFRLSVGIVLSPVQFVPVTPCRLVDTRNPNGEFGGPALQGNKSRVFVIPDNQDCKVPSSAAAYSLNVTAVPPPHGSLGYLTVWPTGRPQPLVSTLNSTDGRVKANAAIVPVGASAAVSVYVTDTTDLLIDIDGYFAPTSGSTLAFYPLPPCRVVDTRNTQGGPTLQGQTEYDYAVQGICAIPTNAQAYSFNFTVIPVDNVPVGYLTVWPQGQSQPTVSTLNDYTATVVANAGIVPAGGNGGEIAAYVYTTGQANLLVDVNGYFAPAGEGGLSLYPMAPCRMLDTRLGNGAFSGTLSPPMNGWGGQCGVPSQSQAYVLNATVVPQGSLGYLTLWPDGGNQPNVSTLNAYDGALTSNMAIVPAGQQNGEVDACAGYGLTNLILDISSYFAP